MNDPVAECYLQANKLSSQATVPHYQSFTEFKATTTSSSYTGGGGGGGVVHATRRHYISNHVIGCGYNNAGNEN